MWYSAGDPDLFVLYYDRNQDCENNSLSKTLNIYCCLFHVNDIWSFFMIWDRNEDTFQNSGNLKPINLPQQR